MRRYPQTSSQPATPTTPSLDGLSGVYCLVEAGGFVIYVGAGRGIGKQPAQHRVFRFSRQSVN